MSNEKRLEELQNAGLHQHLNVGSYEIKLDLKGLKKLRVEENEHGSVEFHIDDLECWICGEIPEELTNHHTLPQHLRPVHNVVVPACKRCHEHLNMTEPHGIQKFIYKATKKLNELIDYLRKKND